MAKDGTNRGGRRVRAGDKPDALADKIADGRSATVMEFPMTALNGADLMTAADLYGEEMPQPSEYYRPNSGTANLWARTRFFVRLGFGSRSAAVKSS